jgi:hypothetical protein
MNKIILLAILAITNICFAQNTNINVGNTTETNYFTEISFEYVNGKIIIPVQINNTTYRFLYDSGAPNLISKKLNDILKTKIIQETTISDANGNKSVMNIVELPDMTIGNIIFQKSAGMFSDDEKSIIFDCFNLDGFIGSNLLRNSIVQIDIKNKVIRIASDGEKLNLSKKNAVDMELSPFDSNPFIWVKLKGKKSGNEQLLLDTGMKGFYDVSNRTINLLKSENIFEVIATGTGLKDMGMFGNATPAAQVRVSLVEMKIANSSFTNITSVSMNATQSRIGTELFEKGIGTIDYKHKKFYFDAYETKNNLSERLLGFSTALMNEKYSIGIVWDEKLKDKISSGDEIIEVNGINYENYTPCDLIAKKPQFTKGEYKQIKVRTKNGEIIKVDL